jgi:hypothetical protein
LTDQLSRTDQQPSCSPSLSGRCPSSGLPTSRRQFLRTASAAAATATLACQGKLTAADSVGPLETFVPYRQITHGPLHHWFGYYDKRQFDATNTLVLSNQVDFEGRSPRPSEQIKVGYVDLANGDSWHPIGTSSAWGWQQGCMLQWIGGQGRRILWNDREGDRFVGRIVDLDSDQRETLPLPIYTLSPDGRYGFTADFRRINNLRPGYGYAGLADPWVDQCSPDQSGVWRVDLKTHETRLIVSLAEAAKIPWSDGDTHDDAWHYFNHLLVNPTSDRIVFLHRYRPKFDPRTLQYDGGFVTRMISANLDGSEMYVLDPSGYTSHFIWDDSDHLTMWTRPEGRRDGFYRFTDRTEIVEPVGVGVMTQNGHNTNLPAPYEDWILNDTYPSRSDRRQTVYLYHRPTGRRVDLGHFPAPPAYTGEWRCDTHPRSSNDGMSVVIDSPTKQGRQLHLLDISEVLSGE